MNGIERGNYTLSITSADGDLAVGFTAQAEVNAGGSQRDDEDCWSFTLNERGLRTASDKAGSTSAEITDRCWR